MDNKPELQISYAEEVGSFAIVDYEEQKQKFVDFINGLEVKPITSDEEKRKARANRASLNKLEDKIKSQRITSTKLIGSQFSYLEKLIKAKSQEYDKAVKEYEAKQKEIAETTVVEEETVVGKVKTYTLTIQGEEALLNKVLDYAKTLGLGGEIE